MVAKRNPSEPPSSDFYKRHSIEELVAQQGASPADLEAIRAEFADLWPDDASIEEFQAFLQESREVNPTQQTGG